MERKASFYSISGTEEKKHLLFVCNICEQFYLAGRKIYIYVIDDIEAQKLDALLWIFHDTSFVPHVIYHEKEYSKFSPTHKPEILIGCTTPPSDHKDILLNLTTDIPPFQQNFAHIVEIIPDDEQLRQLAREHYKHYQRGGCQMEIHKQQI
jgi:DNA polymerase III subunit chi